MISEELIHALITERINMFHDALVERGQIKPLRPQQTAEECPTNRYKEGRRPRSGQTQLADGIAR